MSESGAATDAAAVCGVRNRVLPHSAATVRVAAASAGGPGDRQLSGGLSFDREAAPGGADPADA